MDTLAVLWDEGIEGRRLFSISVFYCCLYSALGLIVVSLQKRLEGVSEILLSMSLILIGLLVLLYVPESIVYIALSMVTYTLLAIIAIILMMNVKLSFFKHAVLPAMSLLALPVLFGYSPGVLAITFFILMYLVFTPKVFGSALKIYLSYLLLLASSLILILLGYIELCVLISGIVSTIAGIVALGILYEEGKKVGMEYGGNEVERKLTHLLAFIILIPLLWAGDLVAMLRDALVRIDPQIAPVVSSENVINVLVIILGINAVAIFTVIELIRILGRSALIPPRLLRKNEERHIASYVYTLAATIIVAILFPQIILITSVFVGLIADASAALVGRYYGRIRITRNRTLEGTVAGLITASLIVILATRSVLGALVVGVSIAIFDALNIIELNDNMVFPILSAIVLKPFI